MDDALGRIDVDEFSAVLGTIYDASLDATLWPEAMAACMNFVGASAGVLGAYDQSTFGFDIALYPGYEDHWMQLYREKYMAMNPFIARAAVRPVGEPTSLHLSGVLHEVEGTVVLEEWIKPQGIVDVCEVILDRSISSAAVFSLVRKTKDGFFDAPAVHKMQLLFPHMRRGVLISRVLKMHREGEGALSDVFDRLIAGVFMLTLSGRILRSNEAGETMLALQSPVRSHHQLLVLPGGADRVFREALHALARNPSELGGKGVCIPIFSSDGRRYLVHMLPLKGRSVSANLPVEHAAVAVFVRPAHPDHRQALQTVSDTFKLTKAEGRVTLAMIEVGSTPMIAEALGVTVATVRTHVRSIYQKTAVRRQSELVSLLQGFMSPVR